MKDSLEHYRTTPKIDAHIHYNHDRPSLMEQAYEDNFLFLTINTDVPFFPSVDQQQQIAKNQESAYSGHIRHITTFTCEDIDKETWQDDTLQKLKKSLANGAVGIKIWKNIGMDLADDQGKMIMIDDPRFDPILSYLEDQDVPVIGHLGEPRNCWLPIEEMTVDSDKDYFKDHPEYHMHLHPEHPSYEDQIKARDNMLAKHPNLRFIGAHLASLEWDVDEVAKRLDKFPKLAVDLAERICHLQYQAVSDHQKVKDFIHTYQDRIIYGTDVIDDGTMSNEEIKKHIQTLWLAHWEYFTTDNKMYAPEFSMSFNGLKLPQEVIEKIYYNNAINWYKL